MFWVNSHFLITFKTCVEKGDVAFGRRHGRGVHRALVISVCSGRERSQSVQENCLEFRFGGLHVTVFQRAQEIIALHLVVMDCGGPDGRQGQRQNDHEIGHSGENPRVLFGKSVVDNDENRRHDE